MWAREAAALYALFLEDGTEDVENVFWQRRLRKIKIINIIGKLIN
jgi:hypothetical protein